MKAIYELAYAHHPEEWIPKKDLYKLVADTQEEDERLNWFGDLSGDKKKAAQTKLGKAISQFSGRILAAGIRLLIDDSVAETQSWMVRFTKKP